MEELIELLNQYESERKNGGDNYWSWQDDLEGLSMEGSIQRPLSDLLIISKNYRFIERLVKNDKIKKEIRKHHDFNDDYIDYYAILMLLSIQDEPIEFLINCLK